MSNEEIQDRIMNRADDLYRQQNLESSACRGAFREGSNFILDELRQLFEREARERTINELVEWMEECSSITDSREMKSAFNICVDKAKSLLNNPVKKEGEEQTR